jgi:ribokinase
MGTPKIAVVGHAEHVTLGAVERVPAPGEIVHMQGARVIAGGGGALAFAQLARGDAEVHFFTAVGSDDAGALVRARLERWPGAFVHAAVRDVPHPRVVVMVDAGGRRTIVVTAEPLQPSGDDALPWATLGGFDAVYFTGSEPRSLSLARAARRLVVTARRRPTLTAAGVAADVVVGSASDPREDAPLEAYEPRPGALVLTDGPRAIRVFSPHLQLVDAPAAVASPRGDYGAGDRFAGALTYFVAAGMVVADAARAAGPYGAAVLGGVDPLEHQAPLARR